MEDDGNIIFGNVNAWTRQPIGGQALVAGNNDGSGRGLVHQGRLFLLGDKLKGGNARINDKEMDLFELEANKRPIIMNDW